MKKLSALFAVLAVVFALSSAFNTKTISGFFANKDLNIATEQIPAQDDQSEVNIDLEVAAYSNNLSAWAADFCVDHPTLKCAVKIVGDEVTETELGEYRQPE